jgi:hypothetical protein
MLILEVTNAQDQLNLLKRIVDSTWSAISAEAAAEAAARQQRAAAAAAKPRVRRAVVPTSKAVATKRTVSKSPVAATANKETFPKAAGSADKAATSVVQRGSAATQTQPQQLRRVYPSSTAQPKPIARLGRVAAVANP